MSIFVPRRIKKKGVRRLTLPRLGGHQPGATVPRRVIAHGTDTRWRDARGEGGLWDNFPGWTEYDPGGDIELSDASAFDSIINLETGFQLNEGYVSVALPATWDNAYGDWRIRFEFNDNGHLSTRFAYVGVASSGTKPYSGAPPSLAADGEDFILRGFRSSTAGNLQMTEATNIGWDTSNGWNGETPGIELPLVYYCEIKRESDVCYIDVFSDSGYTTQLGSWDITDPIGAGWAVTHLLVTTQGAGAGPQHAQVKFTDITPNPWS